ncbi:MAG: hypothetical protein KH216_12685 [Clostridiales bacterium]|nr:hypothetical protein [Clostridiales bacterium]
MKEQQSFFAALHSSKADTKQNKKAQNPLILDRKEKGKLENEACLPARDSRARACASLFAMRFAFSSFCFSLRKGLAIRLARNTCQARQN